MDEQWYKAAMRPSTIRAYLHLPQREQQLVPRQPHHVRERGVRRAVEEDVALPQDLAMPMGGGVIQTISCFIYYLWKITVDI